MKTVLESLNVTADDEILKIMFESMDNDGSKAIDFDEFAKVFASSFAPPTSNELTNAFKAMDKNGDGVLERDELKEAMKSCGQPYSEKDLNDMLNVLDKNGDGKIN